MRVVVTGAGGFLGRRLTAALLERGRLDIDGTGGRIDELIACDVEPPDTVEDARVHRVAGDLAEQDVAAHVVGTDAAAVVHLAAVVSGGAERDFDLGMRANLDGTRSLLEACRRLPAPPRFVFASSVAVFGGDLALPVTADTAPRPQTSYGTQKAIGELLVADYSRKRFVDGRVLRLPTIAVRGDAPNTAVTSFVSNIVRDPVRGRSAACPVHPDTKVWVLSPGRAVAALVRALELPVSVWSEGPIVVLPGVAVTPGELIAALRDLAGDEVADRVRWNVDPFLDDIVSGFPAEFDTSYGSRLGFEADAGPRAVVQAFLDEEAGAAVP